MITFLSGGTGTPKLLDGARDVLNESEISVVVNTGDDIEIAGNLVCPDIDTVLYTLAELIDREKWWGIEDDTTETHEALVEFEDHQVKRVEGNRSISKGRAFSGSGEFMLIGDRDRATHIQRTALIDEGMTLTEATFEVTRSLGVESRVLPMADDPVSTYVKTPEGWIHFQDFWVAKGGKPEVHDVEFRGFEEASLTTEASNALRNPVVIGPSNPVTSIGPILALKGASKALKETRVVAVSPFIGEEIVSGPAPKLMRAVGLEPTTRGVYEAYSDFVDTVVVDESDPNEYDFRGTEVLRADIMMETRDDSRQLAKSIAEYI